MGYGNGLRMCAFLVDHWGIIECLFAEENKDIREDLNPMMQLLIIYQEFEEIWSDEAAKTVACGKVERCLFFFQSRRAQFGMSTIVSTVHVAAP